jgi:PleD family two-component response regulator
LAVFVNGTVDTLAAVEPVLDGRSYDIEFVAPDDEPYATITALKPDLVVVGLDLDDTTGFELLTMLRLDADTAGIPVLSYVKDNEAAPARATNIDPNPSQLPAVTAPRAYRH